MRVVPTSSNVLVPLHATALSTLEDDHVPVALPSIRSPAREALGGRTNGGDAVHDDVLIIERKEEVVADTGLC